MLHPYTHEGGPPIRLLLQPLPWALLRDMQTLQTSCFTSKNATRTRLVSAGSKNNNSASEQTLKPRGQISFPSVKLKTKGEQQRINKFSQGQSWVIIRNVSMSPSLLPITRLLSFYLCMKNFYGSGNTAQTSRGRHIRIKFGDLAVLYVLVSFTDRAGLVCFTRIFTRGDENIIRAMKATPYLFSLVFVIVGCPNDSWGYFFTAPIAIKLRPRSPRDKLGDKVSSVTVSSTFQRHWFLVCFCWPSFFLLLNMYKEVSAGL